MVTNISEDFEPPSKKFLAASLKQFQASDEKHAKNNII